MFATLQITDAYIYDRPLSPLGACAASSDTQAETAYKRFHVPGEQKKERKGHNESQRTIT